MEGGREVGGGEREGCEERKEGKGEKGREEGWRDMKANEQNLQI